MHTELEEARLRLKQVQSMLRMLEGNTSLEDIARLEREWLNPIASRLRDIEPLNAEEAHAG
jgi:hypothetical protein